MPCGTMRKLSTTELNVDDLTQHRVPIVNGEVIVAINHQQHEN